MQNGTPPTQHTTRNLRTTRGKRGQWPKPSKQCTVVVGRDVLSTAIAIACILTDLLHPKCPNPTLSSMYSTDSCKPSPLPLIILSSQTQVKRGLLRCTLLVLRGRGLRERGGWLSVPTCRLDDECIRGLGLNAQRLGLGLWKPRWRQCVTVGIAWKVQ